MEYEKKEQRPRVIEVARIYLTTEEDARVVMGMDYDQNLIPSETAVSLAESLENIVMNLDKKSFHRIYASKNPVASIYLIEETRTHHIVLNENLPEIKTAGLIQ